MGWEKRQTHFPVKATTWGLGTDLWYYEPTANATFRVVWRLEWNGMELFLLPCLPGGGAVGQRGQRTRPAPRLYIYIYIYTYWADYYYYYVCYYYYYYY